MSLTFRKNRFSRLIQNCDEKISDFIGSYKTSPRLLNNLQTCACLFMSKSAMLNHYMTDIGDIVDYYEHNRENIPTMTPNGLIVPKKHSMMEFNLMAMAYYEIIKHSGINKHITSWNIPINLRVKYGKIKPLRSKRASEHAHSDAWVGEFTECGTAMLPIFGDLENNNVRFYDPPEDFSANWLKPLEGYDEGEAIVAKYKQLDYKANTGDLVLSDFAALHGSTVYKDNCGLRISIDSTFAMEEPADETKWRGLRCPIDRINDIGKTLIFQFTDDVNDKVDSQKGFRQAVNLTLRDLK